MTRLDEQLEFLLSRIADGDLTAEERDRLRAAVERDPLCARVAGEYERLGRMVHAFRPLPLNLNWAALASTIAGRVADSAEADASALVDRSIDRGAIAPASDISAASPAGPEAGEYAAVQALLRDWARPLPPVDWQAFKAGISREVRREFVAPAAPSRTSRTALFVNWLAPLAAAAVIALAIAWPRERAGDQTADVGRRADRNIVVVVDSPAYSGSIQLSYDQSFAEEEPQNDEPSVKAIAHGPSRGEWREFDDEQYLH